MQWSCKTTLLETEYTMCYILVKVKTFLCHVKSEEFYLF